MYIFRLATDKQKPALDVAYKIFMKEDSFPNDIRQAALERVCVPMLRLVHTAAVKEFFMDHIKEIVAALEAKQSKVRSFTINLMSRSPVFALYSPNMTNRKCN
jgi:DNA-dependent protein kinase catalytic subunit